jgi:hypothetical protein
MNIRHLAFALPFCLLTLGCEEDFEPVSRVQSVRILAARASTPYAKPGDTVSVDLLATDQRPQATRKDDMKLYSLPTPCDNPVNDLYYACYLGLNWADPEFAKQLQPGADVTSLLTEGPTFTVPISPNVISSHPHVEGSAPFGSIFTFSMACPGRVRYLGLRLKPSPQSPPFGCFDDAGNAFGNDSFVFAFARIFAFDDRSNENPQIDSLAFRGQVFERAELDRCNAPNGANDDTCPTASVVRCTKSDVDDCSKVTVSVSVPPSSQEGDPSSDIGREQIWVDYYATAGKFEDDLRILYDASRGRLSDTGVDFRLPQVAGIQTLWAVVHDNRGGVNWARLRLDVQ